MGEMSRRVALSVLASLPVWVALGAVWLVARDLAEMAAAALAGASVICVVGVLAIAIATRRAHGAAHRQDEVVRQSLALVSCMKEINRRLTDMEQAKRPGLPWAIRARPAAAQPLAAHAALPLAIASEMAPPLARNDAPEVSKRPSLNTYPNINIDGVRCLLTDQDAGVSLTLTPQAGEGAAAALVGAALAARPGERVEIVLPTATEPALSVLATLHDALSADDAAPARYLLGIQPATLAGMAPDGAGILGALLRQGVGLSLHACGETMLDPDALARSAVRRLTIDGRRLAQMLVSDHPATREWFAALDRAGIALCAGRVDDSALAEALAACGVGLVAQPARPEAAPQVVPRLPWRAPPHRRAG